MKVRFFAIAAFYLLSGKIISQTNSSNLHTEVLEYVSATFDPVAEESQILFKDATNQTKLFNSSKQDSVQIEAQFYNLPANPSTTSELNITKTEWVGKKFKITFYGITVNPVDGCCFKMKASEMVK